jgi:sirohydrochlorin cobaltochelatase
MQTHLETGSMEAFLESALAAGHRQIGQVVISDGGTRFSLCHVDDSGSEGLEVFRSAADAMKIAVFDDSGKYRPLKTAPNLRHGWRLELTSLAELRKALDFLYPAALGNWRALVRGTLSPTPLRHTVNRQTGMYRITGKITDEQGSELISVLCQTGCLRKILWPVNPDAPYPDAGSVEGRIPLLCTEACCLFIAAARKTVKGIPLDQVE